MVEAALDDLLRDVDAERLAQIRIRHPDDAAGDRPMLVILPGNVIGPAIASAFCAGIAGVRTILKSASAERALASIVARQFDALGPPLAGTIESRYWKGGDVAIESELFAQISGIIAFGSDKTIADLRLRAPHLSVFSYGDAYSVGLVLAGADRRSAASGAARDVCMFDQAGCMSPQTIYVEGDAETATLFAHALADALQRVGSELPMSPPVAGEAAASMDRLRRFHLTAVAPRTHGLDTIIAGPATGGRPDFIVAVEPGGPPSIAGFGRIVSVKAFSRPAQLREQLEAFDGCLDTVGIAGEPSRELQQMLDERFEHVCALGDMQRPPLGYRPSLDAFIEARKAATR